MNTKKVAIYIRVSTEEQVKEGFSIAAQKDKLAKYAESQSWEVAGLYLDEGISAKSLERPQMKQMLNDMKNNIFDTILVYKLDRLTRSVSDLHELLNLFDEYSIGFRSATEVFDTTSAIGRLFITIVAAMAQWERENLAERVSFGIEQKVREGKYVGTPSVFGYDYTNGELEINIAEAEIVKQIYTNYLEKGSFTGIANEFNRLNIKSKRGGYWTQRGIKNILTNPLYVGKISYKRHDEESSFTVDSANHEAIISSQLFNDVQKRVNNLKVHTTKKHSSDDATFSSVLYCKECGRKLATYVRTIRGRKYRYYRCPNNKVKRCSNHTIAQSQLLPSFEQAILKLNKKFNDINVNKTDLNETQTKSTLDAEKITKEIERLNTRKKRMRDRLFDDTITSDEYKEAVAETDIEINNLNELLLKSTEADDTNDYENLERIKIMTDSILASWDLLDLQHKKQFINTFIKRLEIHKDENRNIELNITFY